ncbi:MAG: hypothetical protein H6830_05690 [Planctomycetes bacterium]|nr:hypothetical protein [Planctomycetota bacterium]MCB9909015.1 hypothetical protein [Planctomycetota bacterium]MCB9911740.1 hypothetical protein [Planctomycetota bacterium]
MARPLRSLTRPRNSSRRRHRTWMRSMSVATLGWGIWWSALAWHRAWPGEPPPWVWVYVVTCCLAGVGMFYAFFTLRARKSWVLMATMAWLANLGLFLLPWYVHHDLLEFLSRPKG